MTDALVSDQSPAAPQTAGLEERERDRTKTWADLVSGDIVYPFGKVALPVLVTGRTDSISRSAETSSRNQSVYEVFRLGDDHRPTGEPFWVGEGMLAGVAREKIPVTMVTEGTHVSLWPVLGQAKPLEHAPDHVYALNTQHIYTATDEAAATMKRLAAAARHPDRLITTPYPGPSETLPENAIVVYTGTWTGPDPLGRSVARISLDSPRIDTLDDFAFRVLGALRYPVKTVLETGVPPFDGNTLVIWTQA